MRGPPRVRPPPPVHAGNDVVGLGSSRPWTFSPLTSLGQVARNATRRGRLKGCRDRGTGRPNPGSRPKAGNLRSLGKRPHLLEPLPPPKLRTEQWADRPMPVQRRTYALAFFPSTPWTDANGSFPPVGRRLGISHSIWLRCLSVHLIDKLPATEQVCGAVRVVSRSPYSGQLLPAWGKRVKSCGFGPGWKGPSLIKAFPA